MQIPQQNKNLLKLFPQWALKPLNQKTIMNTRDRLTADARMTNPNDTRYQLMHTLTPQVVGYDPIAKQWTG